MTYLEAAITVLRASSKPLTTTEIMERITRDDLVPITGRTPIATLTATLYRNLGSHPELSYVADREGRKRAAKGAVRWTIVR
jgi:HB1, ASXL, restriction endonuclease HTH domain